MKKVFLIRFKKITLSFLILLFLILTLGMSKNSELKNDILEYDYYTKICHDKKTAFLICYYSKLYNVPVSLSFATAKNESNFKNFIWHENFDKHGNYLSIDRGIFQLNSLTYRNLKREDFYNPEINIKNGIFHLKEGLNKTDNSIRGTIGIYNGGIGNYLRDTFKITTLNYIEKVLLTKYKFDCKL